MSTIRCLIHVSAAITGAFAVAGANVGHNRHQRADDALINAIKDVEPDLLDRMSETADDFAVELMKGKR